MRIRLEAEDRLPFWIIGDPALPEREATDNAASDSQVLNDNVQITRNQQTITGAEWDVRRVFDRGNSGVVYEATGHRLFADEWERMDYVQTLAPMEVDFEQHRWSGDVWLRSVKPDGAFREWLLPEAVISLTGTRLDGLVGLHLTYRITAPGFDTEAARQGTEGVTLVADARFISAPRVDLFLTKVGGSPTEEVDSTTYAVTWNSDNAAQELLGHWKLVIFARRYVAGVNQTPGFTSGYEVTSLSGYGPSILHKFIKQSPGAGEYATPMSARLSGIMSALDSAWFSKEIVTVGGRQALRITLLGDDGTGPDPGGIAVVIKFNGGGSGGTEKVWEIENTGYLTITEGGLIDAADFALIADSTV